MIRPETEGNNLFYCAFIVVVENTSKCVEIRKKNWEIRKKSGRLGDFNKNRENPELSWRVGKCGTLLRAFLLKKLKSSFQDSWQNIIFQLQQITTSANVFQNQGIWL